MTTSSAQLEQWIFLCKEVAKANDTLDAIVRLFQNINLQDNAYNAFFALLIDALTTKIFLHLGHVFDNQDDSLRLTRIGFSASDIAKIGALRAESEPFLQARHKQHAHISKNFEEINYSSNFRLMDECNVIKIRKILNKVSALLRKWGEANNNGNIIADHWGNIGIGSKVLFENLEEYEFIRSQMSTSEHVEIREKMSKAHEVSDN